MKTTDVKLKKILLTRPSLAATLATTAARLGSTDPEARELAAAEAQVRRARLQGEERRWGEMCVECPVGVSLEKKTTSVAPLTNRI